jgi:heat shock protein HslJ
MKKVLFLLALVLPMMFSSCSSDDDNSSMFTMEELYGKWSATAVKVNGEWIDITKYPYNLKYSMSITFYQNGTYYGSGYFGNGSGTYKVSGNTISTYIDGELYFKYIVKSLSNGIGEVTMEEGNGDKMDVRIRKQ